MIKKIINYRGILIFYALIIVSVIGLNARLHELNKVEIEKEIAINTSSVYIEE